MITVFVMNTCPDCTRIEAQIQGNPNYHVIDIGAHVRNLKAFLQLRDTNPTFAAARRMGFVGIPCFVLEDGSVTLSPMEAGIGELTPQPRRATSTVRAADMPGQHISSDKSHYSPSTYANPPCQRQNHV